MKDDATLRLAAGLPTLEIGPLEEVPIRKLILSEDGPRYGGHDSGYSKMLALVDSPLPPIFVHRESMCVIDGVHRVLAAKQRGETVVEARLIGGSTSDTFILAVRANISYGKPLSLFERERSARRVLLSHPQWSDRAIAEACGLSGKTVGELRSRSTAEFDQLNGARVGRDGRVRPLNTDESRRRAAEMMTKSPQASLRSVAREVGLSPATVRDVRQRLLRGESPLVGHDNGHNGSEAALVAEPEAPVTGPCDAVPLRSHALFEDTALKSMQYGEEFVKMMAAHWISPDDWSKYVGIIPLSRVYIVADLARTYATAWMAFADALVARTAKRSG